MKARLNLWCVLPLFYGLWEIIMKTQFSHRHHQQLAVSTPLQCDLGDGILLSPQILHPHVQCKYLWLYEIYKKSRRGWSRYSRNWKWQQRKVSTDWNLCRLLNDCSWYPGNPLRWNLYIWLQRSPPRLDWADPGWLCEMITPGGRGRGPCQMITVGCPVRLHDLMPHRWPVNPIENHQISTAGYEKFDVMGGG